MFTLSSYWSVLLTFLTWLSTRLPCRCVQALQIMQNYACQWQVVFSSWSRNTFVTMTLLHTDSRYTGCSNKLQKEFSNTVLKIFLLYHSIVFSAYWWQPQPINLCFFRPRSQQTKSTFGNSVGSRILPFPRASVACAFKRSRKMWHVI